MSNQINGATESLRHPENRTAFLGTLCCLYFIQGIPIGLVFNTIPTILRVNDVSLHMMALVSMSGIFWALKFFWGSLVDNYWFPSMGRRKSWIIPMHLIIIGSVFVLSEISISREMIPTLCVVLSIMSFAGATQDIATDGFAAENSHASDLGVINTIQMSGVLTGLLVSGPLALVLFDYVGFSVTLKLLATLVACALLPVWFWKEPLSTNTRKKKASVKHFFKLSFSKSSLTLCALTTVYGVIILALVKFVLVDHGWSLKQIGFITGVGHMMMMLFGCVVAGFVIHWRSNRFVLLVGLSLVILGGTGWMITLQTALFNPFWIWLVSFVVGFGMGFVAVSTYSYFMRFSQQTSQPGTNMAIFQATQTLSEIVFSSLAVNFAGTMGYFTVFVFGALIALFCIGATIKLPYYGNVNYQFIHSDV